MGHKQIYRIEQKKKNIMHQNNHSSASEPNPSISLSMSPSDHLETSDTTSTTTASVVLPANSIGDRNREHNITAVCITTIYTISINSLACFCFHPFLSYILTHSTTYQSRAMALITFLFFSKNTQTNILSPTVKW